MKEADIKLLKEAFDKTKAAAYLGRVTEEDESGFLCRNLTGYGRRIQNLVIEKLYQEVYPNEEDMRGLLSILISFGKEKLEQDPTVTSTMTKEEIETINESIQDHFWLLSTFLIEKTGIASCGEFIHDLRLRLSSTDFDAPLIIAKGEEVDHMFLIVGINSEKIVTAEGFLDWELLKKSDAMIADPWLNEDIIAAKDIDNSHYYIGKYALIPIKLLNISEEELAFQRTTYNNLFDENFEKFPWHFIKQKLDWQLKNFTRIPFEYKPVDLNKAFQHFEQCLTKIASDNPKKIKEEITKKIESFINKLSVELQKDYLKTGNPSPLVMLFFARSRWKTDKKSCAELCIRVYEQIKNDLSNNRYTLNNLLSLINPLSKNKNLDESLREKLCKIVFVNSQSQGETKISAKNFLAEQKPSTEEKSKVEPKKSEKESDFKESKSKSFS